MFLFFFPELRSWKLEPRIIHEYVLYMINYDISKHSNTNDRSWSQKKETNKNWMYNFSCSSGKEWKTDTRNSLYLSLLTFFFPLPLPTSSIIFLFQKLLRFLLEELPIKIYTKSYYNTFPPILSISKSFCTQRLEFIKSLANAPGSARVSYQ